MNFNNQDVCRMQHDSPECVLYCCLTGVAGGATLGQNRNLYQGLFMSSSIVGESLKGAYLLAEVLGTTYGLETNPPPGSATERTDIIQSIQLETREVSVLERDLGA